jgi:epoxide hydrolase-like protein
MAHDTMTHAAVRPFRVDIPKENLDDLRRRIAATRWPSKELVEDLSQGVQLATLHELARYWTTDYDFGRVEARLNALDQFTIEIDGVEIHFIHVTSRHENAERLAVSEAPLPGISPSPPLFLPPQLNERFWHLTFNRLPKINEQLVGGREEIFFGAEFDASAGTKKLPDEAVRYYIGTLASDPEALRGSFEFYRGIDASIAQNEQRKTRRLTLPVLAIGGSESAGEGVAGTMMLAADDVQAMVLPDCGHWVAEQAPEELLGALTAFLAPYRDGKNSG